MFGLTIKKKHLTNYTSKLVQVKVKNRSYIKYICFCYRKPVFNLKKNWDKGYFLSVVRSTLQIIYSEWNSPIQFILVHLVLLHIVAIRLFLLNCLQTEIHIIFTESAHWAYLVIELRFPCVCIYACDNSKHPLLEAVETSGWRHITYIGIQYHIIFCLLLTQWFKKKNFSVFLSQPTLDNGVVSRGRAIFSINVSYNSLTFWNGCAPIHGILKKKNTQKPP